MEDKYTRDDLADDGRIRDNKDSYKNRQFQGKRTMIDEYTGERIYYQKLGRYSKNKTSNVDHVVPLKQLHDRYGNTLSKEKLREIANSDYNLAVTTERINKEKRDLSNHEYLYQQMRDGSPKNAVTTYNMLKNEIRSEVYVRTNVAVTRTVNKAGVLMEVGSKKTVKRVAYATGKHAGEVVSAGTDAAMTCMITSSISNIVLIAQGEKDAKQAAIDVSKEVGGTFISVTGKELVGKVINEVADKGAKKEITSLVAENLSVAEITNAIQLGTSIVKYVNDEITMEECAVEILVNGAGAVAYAIGEAVAGPVAAYVASYVASIVMSEICRAVIEYRNIKKHSEERLRKISKLAAEALVEMEYQRQTLEQMKDQEFDFWDENINKGFETIILSALSDNTENVLKGLNMILGVFGEKVLFESHEEFENFFMSENPTIQF